jgi:hypothetical protein
VTGGWLPHALAAIAEGFCPNHGLRLCRLGYCFACEARYVITGDGGMAAIYAPAVATAGGGW